MQTGAVLALLVILLFLYLLARLFAGPFKSGARILLHFGLGLLLLIMANSISGLFGASLGLNPYNALVAGYLNIPGIILLFLIRYWLRL